jgi:hypothetical protein
MKVWIGFSWLRIDPVAGFCEYGDEPCSFIKEGTFLTNQNPVS